MEPQAGNFLCSFLCINCETQGQLPIPSLSSHQTCGSCELLSEMTCLHCLLTFPVLLPNDTPLPKQRYASASMLNPSQLTLLAPMTCNTCNKPKVNMKQMKYKSKVCSLCYEIFQAKNGLFTLNQFSSMNIQRCKLCHFKKSTKNCQCGLRFCEPCALRMDCFCYFCDGKCSVCDELKVLVTLGCGHRICERCLDAYGSCYLCYKLKCEVCDNRCDSLVEISIIGNICSVCIDGASLKDVNKSSLCKSCCEPCRSYQTEYCKHFQCIHCDIGGLCLKCRFSPKNSLFLYRETCSFCSLNRKGQFLYCGHFVCTDCSGSVDLKRMNYCCKNCLFSLAKRCLNCKKISDNIWEVKDWKLRKICCSKEICWVCCESLTFFKSCKCN